MEKLIVLSRSLFANIFIIIRREISQLASHLIIFSYVDFKDFSSDTLKTKPILKPH